MRHPRTLKVGAPRIVGALAAFLVVLGFVAAPRAASADVRKGVALVIGNGAYRTAPQLENPPLDARAVAASLKRLGFQVIEGYDLDIAHMRAAIAEFSSALPDSRAAIFYYAGHGVSVDEENYVIPTDIVLRSPTDLDLGALSVSLILKQMKREERVNVVILDACRDNPFAAELSRNSRSRSVVSMRGLSRVDADLARGTLIAFASDPKSTALDGPPGDHSPFTKALIDHLEDPGVSIDTVMNRVRSEVWETTHNQQLPWVNTSLIGEFSLNPRPAETAVAGLESAPPTPAPNGAAPADKMSQEVLIWESAQHSNLPGDYRAYLDAYPNGVFAAMAKNRIASLAAPADPPAANPTRVTSPAPAAPGAEVGTVDTERSLDLSAADRREIQQRLVVIGFYVGAASGVLGERTRAAIAEWQKARGASPTGLLGPVQLAALRADSEEAYRRFLAAAPPPAQRARVQTAHRQTPLESAPPPRDDGAASAAAGAFFGGVASGLILHGLNH
ncbi:MAG: caspase family protein [Roseiarcus sp.]